MRLEALRWYSWEILNKYPHLSFAHASMMSDFIISHPQLFDRVAYDVIVGQGRDIPPIFEEYLKRDWKYLTSPKIDALASKSGYFCIIEITEEAGFKPCGQLLGYEYLFRQTYNISDPILKTVVCRRAIPDIFEFAVKNGINIVELDLIS